MIKFFLMSDKLAGLRIFNDFSIKLFLETHHWRDDFFLNASLLYTPITITGHVRMRRISLYFLYKHEVKVGSKLSIGFVLIIFKII